MFIFIFQKTPGFFGLKKTTLVFYNPGQGSGVILLIALLQA
jgi:hypothetical protein